MASGCTSLPLTVVLKSLPGCRTNRVTVEMSSEGSLAENSNTGGMNSDASNNNENG